MESLESIFEGSTIPLIGASGNDSDEQDKSFLKALDQTKDIRDLFLDYIDSLIVTASDISTYLTDFFEKLYNELNSNSLVLAPIDDLYNYLINELFIDTVAVLLYYEKYREVNKLLSHTYFIKTNSSYNPIEASEYFIFRKYNSFIEEHCKPNCHQPKLFTLTGELLVQREKRPILTKESISNADIVLYQLGRLLIKSSRRWFPTTYREPLKT